jgi:uncharacterized protein (DUF1684 family)
VTTLDLLLATGLAPLALAAGVALAGPAPADPAFAAEWKAWHERRLASLRKPQGWLALTGLHWLEPGANVVPGLPGTFTVEGRVGTLSAKASDGWTLAGAPVTVRSLASDAATTPDRLQVGSRTAVVIERSGRLALRVWDAESPLRAGFKGIDTFPPDPRWRVTARWEAYAAPRRVEVPSVTGDVTVEQAPGRAVFTVDGKEYALEPTQDGDGLFFVFKDRTAPRETYGAGRFLTAEAPKDGRVVLDFNRAYNPPCVFTPFATCPLPTPQNVLPVRIEAGEKQWGEGH